MAGEPSSQTSEGKPRPLNRELPIGVFDSGLGGLTVVRQLRRQLPGESILYLGDTARVPYGTRSPSTVVRYARSCAGVLTAEGIKLLVVACNTVSAVALDMLRAELDIPVLGVIAPGAAAAVQVAGELERADGVPVKIGVLGTASTVASGAYPRAVNSLSTRLEVCACAAPLLVPLVEEGWLEGDVPRLAVRHYVQQLIHQRARVLVLGCTHYPLLESLISEVANELSPEPTHVVDSAAATARACAELLSARDLLSPQTNGELSLLVTDAPASFNESAARFLGGAAGPAKQVDLAPG